MDVSELRQRLEHERGSLPLSPNILNSLALQPQKVEQALAWQDAEANNHLICYSDHSYPALLKQCYDPPSVLFAKGRGELLSVPSVAVVGSRDASIYGEQVTWRLSQELVQSNMNINSGMAGGVDGIAHKAAIASGGTTVAVLGTGVECIYPKRHRKLYHDILDSGCVVSEFWPDVKPYAGNFPKRNRIISGLSLGTLVTEARSRSGSLITARLAMEQGREVFAVPGPVLEGNNQGCHELLRNGAKLVETAADILEELVSLYQFQLEEQQESHHIDGRDVCDLPFSSLLASVGYETTTLDCVVEHSGKKIDIVLEQLIELELKGWVLAVPGGYVRQKRS